MNFFSVHNKWHAWLSNKFWLKGQKYSQVAAVYQFMCNNVKSISTEPKLERTSMLKEYFQRRKGNFESYTKQKMELQLTWTFVALWSYSPYHFLWMRTVCWLTIMFNFKVVTLKLHCLLVAMSKVLWPFFLGNECGTLFNVTLNAGTLQLKRLR